MGVERGEWLCRLGVAGAVLAQVLADDSRGDVAIWGRVAAVALGVTALNGFRLLRYAAAPRDRLRAEWRTLSVYYGPGVTGDRAQRRVLRITGAVFACSGVLLPLTTCLSGHWVWALLSAVSTGAVVAGCAPFFARRGPRVRAGIARSLRSPQAWVVLLVCGLSALVFAFLASAGAGLLIAGLVVCCAGVLAPLFEAGRVVADVVGARRDRVRLAYRARFESDYPLLDSLRDTATAEGALALLDRLDHPLPAPDRGLLAEVADVMDDDDPRAAVLAILPVRHYAVPGGRRNPPLRWAHSAAVRERMRSLAAAQV
ncbi:hypothetical protein [Actinosynnema sp. NPDC020468]|uniref:hypothetical protein n=1 Tax=Actinosynnema sp. NPDC020468 TaxID=3154488 RepID=UPI0033C50BF9